MPGVCDRAPDFLSPSEDQVLRPALGSSVALNCTAWVVSGPHCSLPSVQWLKDGLPLGNGGHYSLHEYSWVKANLSEVLVSSVLGVNVTSAEVYGAFTCSIQNVSSSSFTLQRAGPTSHVAAVLASLLVLLALLLAALLYVKCRLNVLLWYQDAYGEVEMNDGKLYDAYVSYSDCPEDRKFVNFILKPQLERRRGYKLFLDDRDLLPRAEPSADLLVNLSRCRRLIVVLSDAFLSRAWCSHSFREGLCRLLELTRRPIFITFEGQRRDPAHPALRLLRQHRHLVTLLLWRPGSVTPSSDFWKELQLALPRKVQYRPVEGDPQTQLQDDKDPMLILRGRVPEGRALDSEVDPDPEGDLGMPAQPHSPTGEVQHRAEWGQAQGTGPGGAPGVEDSSWHRGPLHGLSALEVLGLRSPWELPGPHRPSQQGGEQGQPLAVGLGQGCGWPPQAPRSPHPRCPGACLWRAISSTAHEWGLAGREPEQRSGRLGSRLAKLQCPHRLLLPGVQG
ncbi:SIGIRR isoform 18 [Pongo abelii]|uniref:Single Ig IL-1-related receptor n=1 Tax=Pongo abelii TaxID=9601 RepID=A0A2J8XRL8_PONAB|nr:SIGIRR isoform 18 [Pongo abelii]